MLTPLFKTVGWLLARTPEGILRALTIVLGEAVLWLAPRRRRLILSNLNHVFPEKPLDWHRRMARTCFRRLIETGLLSLATPYLSDRRIRSIGRLSPTLEKWTREKGPQPVVFATLHLALWESQTWFPFLSPVPLPEFGIIFRPLDNSAADAYVKRTRERHGLKLLSRKEGFAEALRILRGGGYVGVLFDQNAGLQGALTTLFGRVCSTTELPGLLATKFGADVRTFYPRRTGFWRVTFESEPVPHDGTVAGVTVALNRWLEGALADEALCSSWLWGHDRWRHQDIPAKRLNLESKRDLLDIDLAARGLGSLPRRTRIWVRLPNWLGDVMIALPGLRALRASRPDAEITLVGRGAFLPLLEDWDVADHFHPLPPRGIGYLAHFHRLRREFPDVWILLTNSARGDLEAWLSRAPQRFGVSRPHRRRPLLTHAYPVPPGFDESSHHQLELWEDFLKSFGLAKPLDRTPMSRYGAEVVAAGSDALKIGLIPGSENEPGKRWPATHWLRLIAELGEQDLVLFGAEGDRPAAEAIAAAAIAAGTPRSRIQNLAGRTTLQQFARSLRTCRLVVANDSGGMHLANALGIPVIGLFGPTSPLRTGPVFSAPCRILQPPDCPPSGGGALSELAPETVAEAIKGFA